MELVAELAGRQLIDLGTVGDPHPMTGSSTRVGAICEIDGSLTGPFGLDSFLAHANGEWEEPWNDFTPTEEQRKQLEIILDSARPDSESIFDGVGTSTDDQVDEETIAAAEWAAYHRQFNGE